MAKTVDNYSTIENFRQRYNELATDVGDISGLRSTIAGRGTLVDAVNDLEDKKFFFKKYEFTLSGSQTIVNGNDDGGDSLVFKSGKIQVFKNENHLIEGVDFTIGAPSGAFFTQITLTSGATLNDKLDIYSFTGSFEGVADAISVTSFFTESGQDTIYNINDNGVILNGDSSTPTTQLESGYTVQLAGRTYAEDDITLASNKTVTSTYFVGDLTGNVTGNASSATVLQTARNISGVSFNGSADIELDTSHIDENGRLYFTDARADARISAADLSDLGNVSSTAPGNDQILVYNSSNSLWEPTNQNDSDSVVEGSSNLYFTNERVDDRVSNLLQAGTGITLSYDDAANSLTISGSAQYGDSDVQSYLSGGAGLTLSGSGSFSVNTSNGVKIDGDDVELDYELVSSAPTSVGSTSTGHLWFVI